jgi:cytochrome c biogenesis protein CcmG/thiol:disulfide interchange protein DsbE
MNAFNQSARTLSLASALLLLAQALPAAPVKLDSLKVGSQIYSSVTIIRVTETDLYFNHDRGVANVKLKYLDPELQRKLDYDPKVAAESERKQTQDDSLFQGSLAAALAARAASNAAPAVSAEDTLADPVSDKSLLGKQGPVLQVTKWLGDKPDLKGKSLLLYFWAPWSVPSRKAIPELNALQNRFADKLAIIGLASESQAEIEAITDSKINFYSAIDSKSKLRIAAGATSIPYVVLLDPKGIVRYQGHPAAITEKKLLALLPKNAE